MSESSRFRVAVCVLLRRWALGVAAVVAAAAPLAGMRYREYSRVCQEHEALEAAYAPVKWLADMNLQLRKEAAALVRDDRLPLELSRHRPAAALLGVASAAAADSGGELFIEHLSITQSVPSDEDGRPVEDRMVIEATAKLTYDIADFVEALKQAPVRAVKVAADDVVSLNGFDCKNYVIECSL
jgi:hypothetical protein